MASTLSCTGCSPCWSILCPRYTTSSARNVNFFLLSRNPASSSLPKTMSSVSRCCAFVAPIKMMSSKYRYTTSSARNVNFFLLSRYPASSSLPKTMSSVSRCCAFVAPIKIMSSKYTATCGMPCKMFSMVLWNVAGAELMLYSRTQRNSRRGAV